MLPAPDLVAPPDCHVLRLVVAEFPLLRAALSRSS